MNRAEDARAALSGIVDVSRETLARFSAYAALLAKWSPRINLVAPSTLPQVWQRHFIDSAQLFPLAPKGARSWIDLGSGAGFPGLVIAVLAAEHAPDLRVTLVDSDARKCAFLSTVIRELALDVAVIAKRIESVPPAPHDVVSARALAPLDRLLGWAAPFAGPGTVCLFPKGRSAASELTEARRAWHVRAVEHRSRTDANAVVLEIGELRRAHPDRD